MKNKTQLIALLIFLIHSSLNTSRATHMMGADMEYRCLGGGKYKFIARVYRDCRGIPFNNPTFGVFAGTNGGNGCGSNTLAITRISISDITPYCSDSSAPCNPVNYASGRTGVEEHIYEAIVDFNTSPLNSYVNNSTCCEVTFYLGQCCRNASITTGPAGNDFYTTCMINICNIDSTPTQCNHSPTLTNLPIIYHCCNTPYRYNTGAIDTAEHDSLSLSLVYGINGLPYSSVNYSSPFSFSIPMTPYCPTGGVTCTPNPKSSPPRGFFFDTANGDMIFTPVKCDEVGIIVVEITERRKVGNKWLVLGKTRRDIQVLITNCSGNNPPEIQGQNVHRICEDDSLCFTISTTDVKDSAQSKADTVELTWNGGIPGASFAINDPSAREKKATFCWTPKIGSASPTAYTFTAHATDENCPIKSESYKGFRVYVDECNTGTRNASRVLQLQFSPQPVRAGETLHLGNPTLAGKPFALYTTDGRMIGSGVVSQQSTIAVNEMLSAGIYFLKVHNGLTAGYGRFAVVGKQD